MFEKHTRERLLEAVAKSKSMTGVLKRLGVKHSMYGHIRRRIEHFGIDVSHFTHQPSKSSNTKKSWRQILKSGHTGYRRSAHQLRRALIESGVPCTCKCGLKNKWRGHRLVLRIDHVNGDWSDNRRSNLRFMCPNCHSQTDTFGNSNLRDQSSGDDLGPTSRCSRVRSPGPAPKKTHT